MGGRALNNYGIKTERKSTEDFNRIALEIQSKIVEDFNDMVETEVVKCYHEKETHGDLDLLIKIDHSFHNMGVNLRDYIQKRFNPRAIHNNGGVYSFDYENFQIDFIPIKESNWEIANVYFSYDPLGNAMGKTFHKMNLSYGWDGLKFKYRNFNGRNSHNISVSKDPRKIFEFGGYDYNRYLKGFDTIEEIFDFIIDGYYFIPDIFNFENLSHIDRKRNRKRGSYHQFLEYIDKEDFSTREFTEMISKKSWVPLIDRYFPESNLLEKLKVLDQKNEINKELNLKFNGRMIMEWLPDLKGKELGDAIREFNISLGEERESFILNSTLEQIRDKFVEFYGQK